MELSHQFILLLTPVLFLLSHVKMSLVKKVLVSVEPIFKILAEKSIFKQNLRDIVRQFGKHLQGWSGKVVILAYDKD